ncbi:MAG: 4Fe-4S binding protein [Desulfovibrio sp.]
MLISPAFFSSPGGEPPVLVAGGGPAGMHAALSLAGMGVPVLLAERSAHLGGQVMRLDKVYPTDHCAFCPVWTTAKACCESPLVNVLLRASVDGLRTDGDQAFADITAAQAWIDPQRCLFCGACAGSCPSGALHERDASMTWDPALPPSMRIDEAACTRCGKCAEACPAGAVRLGAEPVRLSVPVSDVVYATGFEEPAPGTPAHAPEFGGGSHPDIFTAMEFEAWHQESRGQDMLRRKSDGAPAKRVAFIQCAGARDAKHLPYCAAVCCMHAMKQARWLKRRQPGLDITLFYTDLRAPGAGQEAYVRAGIAEGIRLMRSRPGLVAASEAQGGIAVRYDDPETGGAVGEIFDIAVVNGGLGQCPLPTGLGLPAAEGAAPLACGFCAEPADVAGSAVQGAAAAAAVAARRCSRAQGGNA